MAQTKKEFVTEITAELEKSARTVLAGHGIPGAMLTKIISRPDIVAKLVNFALNTTNFRKGKRALVKTNNFKISAYKNFADFNTKARNDVSAFMGRLTEADLESFTNDGNIITILALPDASSGDLDLDISTGKSTLLKFNTSVKKEYKLPGGFYITIMWGDSLIRKPVQAEAKRKARKNAIVVTKQENSPAKVKNKLTKKDKAKKSRLAGLKSKVAGVAGSIKKLTGRRGVQQAYAQQTTAALQAIGAKGSAPRNIAAAKKRIDSEINKALNSLSAGEMLIFKAATREWKKGNLLKAGRLMRDIPNLPPVLEDFIRKNGKIYADDRLRQRVSGINASIKGRNTKIETLRQRAANAKTSKERANLNFAIRKEEAEIKKMSAAARANRGLIKGSVNKKGSVISSLNSRIAQLQAKGATIQQAIQVATNGMNVAPVVKQQIAQQVIQQIAQQIPVEYAVQQVIQQIPSQQLNVVSAGSSLPTENFEMDLVQGNLWDRVGGILGIKK